MAVIKKKIWKEFYDAVESGKKKYELRLNDFKIEEGDTFILEEWDREKKEYTGRSIERKVAYVGKFGLDDIYKFKFRARDERIWQSNNINRVVFHLH